VSRPSNQDKHLRNFQRASKAANTRTRRKARRHRWNIITRLHHQVNIRARTPHALHDTNFHSISNLSITSTSKSKRKNSLYYTLLLSSHLSKKNAFTNEPIIHPVNTHALSKHVFLTSCLLGHIPHLALPKRIHPPLPRQHHPCGPHFLCRSLTPRSGTHQRTLTAVCHDVAVVRVRQCDRVLEAQVFCEGEAEDGCVVCVLRGG
jgi:hypothetical protein